jgi:hypothetical protein
LFKPGFVLFYSHLAGNTLAIDHQLTGHQARDTLEHVQPAKNNDPLEMFVFTDFFERLSLRGWGVRDKPQR